MDNSTNNKPIFNYIITIHNKEDLIENVLNNVINCCGKNSYIYPVLDGCSDNTESIIDKVIKDNQGISIIKVFTDDVHELLTINEGLKAASQEGEGYNIILQDDVLLEDNDIEDKVFKLYQWGGDNLGYISFRLGANLDKNTLKTDNPYSYVDYVENAYGHGIKQAKMIPIGYFAFRNVAIKSPVCIPFKLIRDIGIYNEKLAPYGHDDLDYSIRAINSGYYNGVFSIKFKSELEWGGTRSKTHLPLDDTMKKNMDNIRYWYQDEISKLCSSNQPKKIVKIKEMATVSEKECKSEWNRKIKYTTNIHYYSKIVVRHIYTKFNNVMKIIRKFCVLAG